MLGVLVRLLADATLIGTLLFLSAGTIAWKRAWVLLAVMLLVRTVSAIAVYRVNPDLIRERAKPPIHPGQPRRDKLLLLAVIVTGFVLQPLIVGADAFHWHVLPRPLPLVSYIGLAVFALGWIIQGIALRTNAFATSVIRLQSDRKHAVVDSGVYGIVRHPFYVGTPLVIAGLGLWLESYLAALFTVVATTFLVMRIRLEERFLEQELPGYREYEARVRHRLLPGVW